MQSHNTSSPNNRGFTLIEMIIVIAIMSVIGTLGTLMSLDAYRGFSFHSELDVAVSLLTRARSAAMANRHNTSWGVCVRDGNYVVFRGDSCIVTDTSELTPVSAGTTIAGLSSPVVFSQIAGTTTDTTVTVTQNSRSTTITINYEGTIIW